MKRQNQKHLSQRREALFDLQVAFERGDLVLYLGAGISVGSGLPTWDGLVQSMYFDAIRRQPMQGLRPFSNYLYAITKSHLDQGREPLDITARKIRKYYPDNQEFLENLRKTLYRRYAFSGSRSLRPAQRRKLRAANPTIDGIARLCEQTLYYVSGLRAVITYNYDELLEAALDTKFFQTLWKQGQLDPGVLPIYHVHGYIPAARKQGSTPDEIIFTEDQYHLAARDAYSWSSLVQIQHMSGSVGLMIGMSLTDRNMRRLLDAISTLPSHRNHYALMLKPRWNQPTDAEADELHEQAQEYLETFSGSGIKQLGVQGEGRREQIREIVHAVERLDQEQQTFVFSQLGIKPIWYENHSEIREIVNEIINPKLHQKPKTRKAPMI